MVPSPITHVGDYLSALKTAVDSTSNSAQALPDDIAFHRSLDRKFRQNLDKTSERLLTLTNRLLRLSETFTSGSTTRASLVKIHDKPVLEDEDDVVDNFHSVVVDVMDPLLEQVDHCLDIHSGQIKPVQEKKPEPITPAVRLPQYLLHAANLRKPQLSFKTPVNNSLNVTWKPHLQKKWNALDGTDSNEYTHPYRREIQTIKYPPVMFQSSPPIPPKTFENTPFTWVSTQQELNALLSKLRQASEIAVDLEHHSYRSYYGFVCLMQISTREEDWVIDTLALREELEVLNEVFTNPRIVKVFHGAESDIVWLQENSNLYIVNLFDTFHASKTLALPRHSLAALLSIYCDFIADKRYQLADWRIRPLPQEMLFYARSDTHFLLFVYDNLREALLEHAKGADTLVRQVLRHSEETALREFVREGYDADHGEGTRGWAGLAKKWNKKLVGVQRAVFLAVHAWRDKVAREQDENPVYVMSNQMLLTLIERQPIPSDLLSLHTSFHTVPPLLRARGQELVDVIQKAVEQAEKRKKEQITEEDLSTIKPRHIIFDTQPTVVPDLWTQSHRSTTMIAKTSSLFGDTKNVLKAKQSTLFGNASSSKKVDNRTAEIIARIHKGIKETKKVVTVKANAIPAPASVPVVVPVPAPLTTLPEEIAFVPRSERQTKEEDTIVVVGQRKKRKRIDSNIARKKKKEEEELPTEIEMFDYASAPNVLDEGMKEIEEEGRNALGNRKKGTKKKGGYDFSGFGPAPKAMNEPKGGNKSGTFR